MPSNDTLAVDTQSTKVWGKMLGGNPVPWLLSSDEPAARWVTLTAVLDREQTDPAVLEARQQVVADIHTLKLVERLPKWASGVRLSGHDSPEFAPHLLNLLADMGVRAGDFDRIEALLDAMLAHREPSSRFPSYGVLPGGSEPIWGSLLCDSHPILEVLVRFGREQDARVQAGLARMASDLTATAQGTLGHVCPIRSLTGAALVASPTSVRW